MLLALDSAMPPNAAQAAAAFAAGVRVWGGYLSTAPFDGKSHFNLARPWSQEEFAIVQAAGLSAVAYFSGWDDPAGCRRLAAAWKVKLCLDVEDRIRGDGPWVQSTLDAAASGLYGGFGIHPGRRAAFHIASWYLVADPRRTWPPGWSVPATPCGWQWQNTHDEFGVGVDRSWLDDWFAQGGAEMMTDQQRKGAIFEGFLTMFGRNPESEAEFAAIWQVVAPDGSNLYDVLVSMWNDPRAVAYRARSTAVTIPPGTTFTAETK